MTDAQKPWTPPDDIDAGYRCLITVEAYWKPCVHGGGWWVARDADGVERLMAPDAFAPFPAAGDANGGSND
jgi:hypothetical protein